MTSNVISKFQMRTYKILEFHYSMPIVQLPPNDQLDHQFVGKYQINYLDNKWVGLLIIEYSAKTKNESDSENAASLSVLTSSIFEFDALQTPESKEQFTKMLKSSGAVAVLSTLRGNVSAATSALGRYPCLIVPSVNLHHFEWEEIQ